jgi:hypothetical protein
MISLILDHWEEFLQTDAAHNEEFPLDNQQSKAPMHLNENTSVKYSLKPSLPSSSNPMNPLDRDKDQAKAEECYSMPLP